MEDEIERREKDEDFKGEKNKKREVEVKTDEEIQVKKNRKRSHPIKQIPNDSDWNIKACKKYISVKNKSAYKAPIRKLARSSGIEINLPVINSIMKEMKTDQVNEVSPRRHIGRLSAATFNTDETING